jgi:dihydroorotase
MMNKILIEGGEIIQGNGRFSGYIVINGELIEEVGYGEYKGNRPSRIIDARGKWIMPGVIDDQVHFREPGMTHKADIASESRTAIAGGVTSFMDMPNNNPATTTNELIEEKFAIAAQCSPANYSFYFGATEQNGKELNRLDSKHVCGVKLFMGSSTGSLLVTTQKELERIFAESPILIATHCEDNELIAQSLYKFKNTYGDNIQPAMHPLIRSAEACYRSTAQAVELADKYGSKLHVLHLSTARELTLFDNKPLQQKKITNELCVHHLWFSDKDYARLGNRIKWNPAIKSESDRLSLLEALKSGRADVIGTDHAPHTDAEKSAPYLACPSGGPFVQHSLLAMLELAAQGYLKPEEVIEKMCHAPAELFAINNRGFIKEGFYADLVIVNPNDPWTVSKENILSKCGWSPLEGYTFTNKIETTIVNGHIAYDQGQFDLSVKGKALEFNR